MCLSEAGEALFFFTSALIKGVLRRSMKCQLHNDWYAFSVLWALMQ